MKQCDLSKKSLVEILEDFEKAILRKDQESIKLYKEYMARKFSVTQNEFLIRKMKESIEV